MASAPLGSLTLDLIANTAKLTQGLNQAQQQLSRFQTSVTNVAKGFGQLAGAYLTFQALSGAISAVTNSLDRLGGLGESAAAIGTTVQTLQTLQSVAVGAGIEASALETAFGKLTGAIAEAGAGSDEAHNKFAKLGVAYRTSTGELRDSFDVFTDIAKRIEEAGSETEALGIAAEAFGERGGRRMITVMREVAAGGSELRQEMIDTGQVIGDDLVAAADQAGDKIASFGRLLTNVFDAVVASWAPQINAIVQMLYNATLEIAKFFNLIGTAEQRQANRLRSRAGTMDLLARSAADAGRAAEQDFARAQAELDRTAPGDDARRLVWERERDKALRAQEQAGNMLQQNRQEQQLLLSQIQQLQPELTVEPPRSVAGPVPTARAAGGGGGAGGPSREDREAQTEMNRLIAEANRLYEQARTPAAEYADTINRITELMRRGAFTPEQGGLDAGFLAAGNAAKEFIEAVNKIHGDPMAAIAAVRESLTALSQQYVTLGGDAGTAAENVARSMYAAMEPFREEAANLFESTRTPMEEFEQRATRIQAIFATGSFANFGGGETAMRAMAEAAGAAAAELDRMGKDTEPALQALRDNIRRLGEEMIRSGQMSEEQFPEFMRRAMEKAGEAMQDSPYHRQVQAIRQATDVIASDIEDAFTDMSSSIEERMDNMVNSIIRSFARMAYRMFLEPSIAMLLKGGAGMLSSFFGTPGMVASAKGNAFNFGQVIPFAKGGVLTAPTIGPLALMGEAGPEGVFPLMRTATGDLGVQGSVAASPVVVNVYNNTGSEVRTSERMSGGTREIDVHIEQVVQRGFADGSFDRTLGSSYGIRRHGSR